jgi:hypothetical protein
MQYSVMARIARKMQRIVESELVRLHKDLSRRAKPSTREIDVVKKRARLVVLKGGRLE